MSMLEVKRLLYTWQEVKSSSAGPQEHLKAEIVYHEAASEYWDNQVGSSLTYSDAHCTKKWAYHQAQRDAAWLKLQKST